ncbi:hypothetical protein V8C40DRAFT_180947 [Trichoderma camerunense]
MGGQLDGLDGLTDKRIGQDIEVEWRWSCLLTGESHSKANARSTGQHARRNATPSSRRSALLCFASSVPATGTPYILLRPVSHASGIPPVLGSPHSPNKPKRQGTLQTPGLSHYLVIAMTPTTCCYWQ